MELFFTQGPAGALFTLLLFGTIGALVGSLTVTHRRDKSQPRAAEPYVGFLLGAIFGVAVIPWIFERAQSSFSETAIEFTDIPTEQTTAATDVGLAVLALLAIFYLRPPHRLGRFRANTWRGVYSCLGIASVFGAAAHGLAISSAAKWAIWQPLYLALGTMLALVVVAAIYDAFGRKAARRALTPMISVGLLFYLISLLVDDFIVVVIFETVAMGFALAVYSRLAYLGWGPGSKRILLGILVTMLASGIQACSSIRFTMVWEFDHNGTFHLIQMVGLVLICLGVVASANSTRSDRKGDSCFG